MAQDRLEFAKSTVKIVGNELLDHFYTGNREAKLKPDLSMVTEADYKADIRIQEMIKNAFPSDGILSEESSTTYPENDHVWVIDPLDGTDNFSLGLHYWGVSIAHLKDGKPQDAALYFPIINEIYSASAGTGAELNGKTIHISIPPEDPFNSLFIHCSRMFNLYQVDLPYKRRSLGSAAYSLCLIPKGTAVLAFESTPKIWDIAGSWLIVEEGGGLIRSLEAQQPFPAQPGINYNNLPFPIISAATEMVMNEAAAGILKS